MEKTFTFGSSVVVDINTSLLAFGVQFDFEFKELTIAVLCVGITFCWRS